VTQPGSAYIGTGIGETAGAITGTTTIGMGITAAFMRTAAGAAHWQFGSWAVIGAAFTGTSWITRSFVTFGSAGTGTEFTP
jgi:hypothetical protein